MHSTARIGIGRALTCATLALAWISWTRSAPAQTPKPVEAKRGTPAVDGILDDAAWKAAPWTGPFVQREPAVGARASHQTRTRVTYDDRAVYVAVECETDARVEARMGRRDQIPTGEALRVLIDAHGDGNGAKLFSTNPSGMQADAQVAADGTSDIGWDAVWDVETTVTPRGWRAEFRIPWSVLRFDAHAPNVRIQVERDDYAAGEVTALVGIPQNSPKFVARFAPMQGVSGLRPVRVFELRPYLLGRWRMLKDPDRLDPTGTWSGSVGTDLKLGITNDLMLDATLNPDFGQVEVDPAVLNLTTYEPFFQERRPFFLEGSDLFKTPIRILHTRRIGQSVEVPDPIHPGGEMTSVDPTATIWGATKVTGRIGGVSVGILEGTTAAAYGTERYTDAGGAQHNEKRTVLPVTNWVAARVRTTVGNGSTVGGMATHVGRFGRPDDAVGSLDWDIRIASGVHRFNGQLAASRAWNLTDERHSGTAAHLALARAEDPTWLWTLQARALSRSFDPNGLGYLERPDVFHYLYDTTIRTPNPVGVLRSAYANPWVFRQTNMDGLVVDQHVGLDVGITTRAQWGAGLGGRYITPRYDDRETRGGIAYRLQRSWEGWQWWNTDPRPALRGGSWGSVASQNGGHRATGSVWFTWSITPSVSLSWTTTARLVVGVPRWADTEVDATGRDHYVFGRQDARIFDNMLRAGVALSRRATIDLYSQLLVGTVRYRNYQELVEADVLTPYTPSGDKSYQDLAVTINAVAKYEYLPGGFVTLVYLQRQALSPAPGDPGYGTTSDLLRTAKPDSMLMAKLSYLVM
ncbi:MAG: carbohydrate binding family 9 domain-containing protein [Deltaproteobacteria bacterium]|nr:carbohydrate binding family 9 domain-containing protein [Deltaproteobacteria bacterium]